MPSKCTSSTALLCTWPAAVTGDDTFHRSFVWRNGLPSSWPPGPQARILRPQSRFKTLSLLCPPGDRGITLAYRLTPFPTANPPSPPFIPLTAYVAGTGVHSFFLLYLVSVECDLLSMRDIYAEMPPSLHPSNASNYFELVWIH